MSLALYTFFCKVESDILSSFIKSVNSGKFQGRVITCVVFSINYSQGFLLGRFQYVALLSGQGRVKDWGGIFKECSNFKKVNS